MTEHEARELISDLTYEEKLQLYYFLMEIRAEFKEGEADE